VGARQRAEVDRQDDDGGAVRADAPPPAGDPGEDEVREATALPSDAIAARSTRFARSSKTTERPARAGRSVSVSPSRVLALVR
jgi:hypothetical protein